MRVLLSDLPNRCVTFYRPDDPRYYPGYRFLEGTPLQTENRAYDYSGQPTHPSRTRPDFASKTHAEDLDLPAGKGWLDSARVPARDETGGLEFHSTGDGSAKVRIDNAFGHLELEMTFEPAEHGLDLWLLATSSQDINGSFCLQQCLRYTGRYNQEWRSRIAHTPYLSELDMHAMGRPNATLTYGRRDGQWAPFPVQHTAAPAVPGYTLPADEPAFDHGLIVRESPHRQEAPEWYWQQVAPGMDWDQITSGIYWERTALISNRHPADCVHAWVDLGPLPAGETRLLRGKFYYLAGGREDLLARWRRDFLTTF